MQWEPITRIKGSGEPRPHPRDALLFEVVVRLNRAPPQEWKDIFDYPAGHIALVPGGLKLSGDTVTVSAEESQFEDVVAQIDKRIEMANRQYEREVLPMQRAAEERRKREEAAKAERLAAARARVKKL